MEFLSSTRHRPPNTEKQPINYFVGVVYRSTIVHGDSTRRFFGSCWWFRWWWFFSLNGPHFVWSMPASKVRLHGWYITEPVSGREYLNCHGISMDHHPWPTNGCKIAMSVIFAAANDSARRLWSQFMAFFDTTISHLSIFSLLQSVFFAMYRVCRLCIFIPFIWCAISITLDCHFLPLTFLTIFCCPFQGNETAGDFYGQLMGWVNKICILLSCYRAICAPSRRHPYQNRQGRNRKPRRASRWLILKFVKCSANAHDNDIVPRWKTTTITFPSARWSRVSHSIECNQHCYFSCVYKSCDNNHFIFFGFKAEIKTTIKCWLSHKFATPHSVFWLAFQSM